MIKIIIFLIILFPSICFADVSGYLFFGKYIESSYMDLEKRPIKYHAGIHLDIKIGERWPVLFVENKTVIGGQGNIGFNPSQINYKIGLKQTFQPFEIIIKHKCLHPIDGISNGRSAQSYNLIEGRYNF